MKRAGFAFAATMIISNLFAMDWWLAPTICQPSKVDCYAAMSGAGFDTEMWDAGAVCRGMKLVCPGAVIDGGYSAPVAMPKADISNSAVVSEDFDLSVLNISEGCYGARKTRNNGTNAKVGTRWVNVYCAGLLTNPDEQISTIGEIMLAEADQPTCKMLAEDGWLGILDGQCYGKTGFSGSDFFLECVGSNLLPQKIVVLGGAGNYRTSDLENPPSVNYPVTTEQANALFDRMIANAAEQRKLLP